VRYDFGVLATTLESFAIAGFYLGLERIALDLRPSQQLTSDDISSLKAQSAAADEAATVALRHVYKRDLQENFELRAYAALNADFKDEQGDL
jgi:hypothetical protein